MSSWRLRPDKFPKQPSHMPETIHQEPTMLRDALVFLMAAIIVVPLFQRLRANPIIGYLIAGAVVGPFGFALIHEVEGSHRLAEYGIVFMLFLIGLELSLERLKAMARYVFGLGLAPSASASAPSAAPRSRRPEARSGARPRPARPS